MEKYIIGMDNFLGDDEQEIRVCNPKTGVCVIKTKDGLIEKQIIEKKLVLEDGRELLKEERPITHSSKKYIR